MAVIVRRRSSPDHRQSPLLPWHIGGERWRAVHIGGRGLRDYIHGMNQWVFSLLAVIMGVGAVLSLWHGDLEQTAASVGEAWIRRINDASAQAAEHSPDVRVADQ